ncbi:hypothetical protein [Methanobacterium subterraneum]|uniref:hypothetical protein n=1 Tax=Methanobacterium subterraneum TaxID=59277 RepID=UPI0013000908|nr:hypothetical protein [Methanobacterium subterraneum]MBW4257137.1 hypothetical protein [Methanobacterium sp. YSL]
MIGYIGLIAAMVFISGGSVFIYEKKKKNMYFNKGYWLGIGQLVMGIVILLAFLENIFN